MYRSCNERNNAIILKPKPAWVKVLLTWAVASLRLRGVFRNGLARES